MGAALAMSTRDQLTTDEDATARRQLGQPCAPLGFGPGLGARQDMLQRHPCWLDLDADTIIAPNHERPRRHLAVNLAPLVLPAAELSPLTPTLSHPDRHRRPAALIGLDGPDQDERPSA